MTYPYDDSTQRLSAPTTRIDYHEVADDLANTERWQDITSSIMYIAGAFLIVVIAVVVAISILYPALKWLITDMIATGISTYTLLAPALLLMVLAYLYGKSKR